MNSIKFTTLFYFLCLSIGLTAQWAPIIADHNPHIITDVTATGDIPAIQHHNIPFIRLQLNQGIPAGINDGAGLNFRKKGTDDEYTNEALLWYNYSLNRLYFAKDYSNPLTTTAMSIDTDLGSVTSTNSGFANLGQLSSGHMSIDDCTLQAKSGPIAEQTIRINPYGGGVVINGHGDKTAADDELKLYGDLCLTGMVKNPSDLRLKHNIQNLNNAIDQIKALRPVAYFYSSEEHPEMNLPDEKRMGFIAQEVESIFPELVFEDSSDHQWKSMNYMEMIPVTVKAIQEQQDVITSLKSEISKLQLAIKALQ